MKILKIRVGTHIRFASGESEIKRCYPVMSELRPKIGEVEFFDRVRRQEAEHGYRLVYLSVDGEVKAVAGIRIGEWLANGKYLEIEDLVTKDGERSQGHGGDLFNWIRDYAKGEGCGQLRLVSNVIRWEAHRFYLNKRMVIDSHFFVMPLTGREA